MKSFDGYFLCGCPDSKEYQKDKIQDEHGEKIKFTHKSRIHSKELHVNVTKPDQKKPVKENVKVDQKQMVYYSKKYDGYYSIVTSELNMSDIKMRNVYRGLSRIEDTFKISKSDFSSRPVYVRTNDHIDVHFTTCFTALVLIRLLQAKLENKYPVGRIIEL